MANHCTGCAAASTIRETFGPLVRAAAFGVALLMGAASSAAAQSQADEYRVKAAFLFHFAQLVAWPPDAVLSRKSFDLCTVGDDPFRGELESQVEGKAIGSQTMHVRHLKLTQDVRGCQMIFAGREEAKEISALLTLLGTAPVVTVGESDDFLLQGGIIRFCLEQNRIRFEINLDAAEKAKLKISSRLLLLAKSVIGNQGAR